MKLPTIKIILVLLLLSSTVASIVAAQDLAAQIFNKGMQLYATGDYAGAADYLDQVVSMNPGHDQARYYLVYSLTQTGKTKKAMQHANFLAEKFPQHQQYRLLQQQLNQQQFSLSSRPAATAPETAAPAEPEVKQRVSSPPPREATRPKQSSEIDQAISLIDEENYASAALALQKILAKSPRDSQATHYLGVAAFNQRNFVEATTQFEKAISLGEKNFETHFLAGSSYLNLQKYDKAAQHFKKALEIKDDIFCRLNLAEILMKTAKYKDAEQMYKAIMKSHPDVIDAQAALAQILFEQGYVEAASKSINEVLSGNPDNARARLVKARILMESKMYAEAADEARLAFAASPSGAEYRACLALALIRNFQVPQGIEEAKAELQQHPDNIDAMLAIAEGYIVTGDLTAAATELEAAEKKGQHPGVSYLMASLAITRGDQQQARRHYDDYRRRSNGQPRATLDYARFLETTGEPSEAAVAYHEIVRDHEQTVFAEEAKTAIERLAHADSRPASTSAPRTPIPGMINP
ncbi:MAG TPA: tetratricopeptide repeat protein [Candidatus Rifleibacterium sp.]|nr:tetratricopeptide repeat protein [Candidatus Rifleibacterium sp.]HPT44764.1 tetratricopeptide repeat protein [Candidatus Rifleibacterium sp.]